MKKKLRLTQAIMLQGTCSNAGKSLLTCALGRLLTRFGLKVAPFKAQNMSLNSYVTLTGKEMGRAQALQAYACGLKADERMNPVLLKPLGDKGSQVMLLGEPWGRMESYDFRRPKSKLWQKVKEAYLSLSCDFDLMLLEGAGSPAEINLRRSDIVNMRMAKWAKAKVLLVADIDRGGAFAALVGTMQLLRSCERNLVAGYILNKFRGDPSLLGKALKRVETLTGKPFWAIMPYVKDLQLAAEDSVSFWEAKNIEVVSEKDRVLDLGLICLPHISNTTDFEVLNLEKDVRLRMIKKAQDFKNPDILLIPGTRNTGADLGFLRESQLDSLIREYAAWALTKEQGIIIGICGGLQILGEKICDPFNLEFGGELEGLKVLPVKTTLEAHKTLRRINGMTLSPLTNKPQKVEGYEIHHGVSVFKSEALVPLIRSEQQEILAYGLLDPKGTVRIIGTYLHGLFDSDLWRNDFLNQVRKAKGLAKREPVKNYLNYELDRLADTLAEALPLDSFFKALEINVPIKL
ncbi:MAG: cobyric acid synthase [Desulfovibrionaceae bacterium]|nr:cobyric acid synthase [Desulfovibrionaceae bacterium]